MLMEKVRLICTTGNKANSAMDEMRHASIMGYFLQILAIFTHYGTYAIRA